ncbi:uroplakin-3b-like protein 1 [Ctenodactylus gundi]
MGLTRGQFQLLTPLWLLLTCVQPRMGLEHISYAPQLSSAALAGKLTQSTFTLEQPLGQFDQPSISDFDPIWLVVAHSNATQNFVAPRKAEDIPVPASFAQRGYYFTLVADRQRYPSSQGSSQLRVLRVGNDTRCPLTKRGCNSPLLGPGPYRVKFLVMKDSGPAAETDWSPEIRLQQAREVQGVQGLHSAGSVVLIAFLSVLLAILLAALLLLLIHTCCSKSVGARLVESPLPGTTNSDHGGLRGPLHAQPRFPLRRCLSSRGASSGRRRPTPTPSPQEPDIPPGSRPGPPGVGQGFPAGAPPADEVVTQAAQKLKEDSRDEDSPHAACLYCHQGTTERTVARTQMWSGHQTLPTAQQPSAPRPSTPSLGWNRSVALP